MKSIVPYCFTVLFFLCRTISAQIEFTVSKADVTCNNFSLGSIEINVNSTNPPYSYEWSNGKTTSSISNLEVGSYTVKITDGLSEDTIISIVINEIMCEMVPEIVFTPNGDGYNDSWFITNTQFFPDALILVYNRWGQKVFEHSGLYQLPWDGRDLLGAPLPDASYYFILYKDRNKEKDFKKGVVSILR